MRQRTVKAQVSRSQGLQALRYPVPLLAWGIPAAAEACASLESLQGLWAPTSDAGRKAIAEAVFERIDVLGANDFTVVLTAHARAGAGTRPSGPASSA